MTIEITALVLSIAAILFTLVTAIFSVLAYSKVIGMEKSTHQVQWMPLESPSQPNEQPLMGEDLLKKMSEEMYPDIDEEMV